MPIFHFKTNNILHQVSRISRNNVVRYMMRAYGRTRELIIFLILFFGFFAGLSIKMTLPNMLNTFMNTAYKLLIDTVFYIMAITVMTGAISKLFVEFGVVVLLEKMLKPLMKPLYNLPGVASLGAVMTFLSDNPAIRHGTGGGGLHDRTRLRYRCLGGIGGCLYRQYRHHPDDAASDVESLS